MFNCYSVRPIGSKQFFEHLKDEQTKVFYNTELSCKETKIDMHGNYPWGKNKIDRMDDACEALVMAIIANSIMDYLWFYYQRELEEQKKGMTGAYWLWNSKCIDLENRYFRRNPFLEEIFDVLLRNVCWGGLDEIEACMKRMRKLLRWSKQTN